MVKLKSVSILEVVIATSLIVLVALLAFSTFGKLTSLNSRLTRSELSFISVSYCNKSTRELENLSSDKVEVSYKNKKIHLTFEKLNPGLMKICASTTDHDLQVCNLKQLEDHEE